MIATNEDDDNVLQFGVEMSGHGQEHSAGRVGSTGDILVQSRARNSMRLCSDGAGDHMKRRERESVTLCLSGYKCSCCKSVFSPGTVSTGDSYEPASFAVWADRADFEPAF